MVIQNLQTISLALEITCIYGAFLMSCIRHVIDNVQERRRLCTKKFNIVKSGVRFCFKVLQQNMDF